MNRIFLTITMLAVTPGLTAPTSTAQNAFAGQLPQSSATMQAAVPPQTIDLPTAKKIVAAAEASAVAANKKVTICVMDANGDVVLAERMDGASHNAVISAQFKARTAILFGIPTGQIAQAIQDKKPISAPVQSLATGLGGEIAFSPGGLPIMKDGKMIGAIGVGGTPTDDKFSQAGIDALLAK